MIAYQKSESSIRAIDAADLPRITAIFNEAIEAGECTNDVRPRTVEQMTAWLTGDLPDYETYVYESSGDVQAWAAITRYHEREAYRPTVELVVFVTRAARHAGIGGQLMNMLLERAKQLGFHSAVLILFPEPLYVIESAKKLGFGELGRLHNVYPAEGSWRDIVLFQRRL
jgi:Sortase and related acyltransferases